MARDITVTFDDGSSHVYKGAPDDITPTAVQARAEQEFGKAVTALDGGKKSATAAIAPAVAQKGERTWGEALTDLGAGAVSGAGQLFQFPGQLYGLRLRKKSEKRKRLAGSGQRSKHSFMSLGLTPCSWVLS